MTTLARPVAEGRAGDSPVQHEDEHDVEHDRRDRRQDQADHRLPGRPLGADDLLEAERRGEHGHEREHDPDVARRRGHGGRVGAERCDDGRQQREADPAEHGAGDERAPERGRRHVLDLAGLRRVGLGRAEQPRHERPAADAEDSPDGHDEAEQRGAERDGGEQRGVVLRADEAGVDDVVERADDHGGGHRHAEVHERPQHRGAREVPAVRAGDRGWCRCWSAQVRRCRGWGRWCSWRSLPGRQDRAPTDVGTTSGGVDGPPVHSPGRGTVDGRPGGAAQAADDR